VQVIDKALVIVMKELTMKQYDKHDKIDDHIEREDNSTVDMYALLGLVVIVVVMAVYFVSR